jgi:hypothetical protein
MRALSVTAADDNGHARGPIFEVLLTRESMQKLLWLFQHS